MRVIFFWFIFLILASPALAQKPGNVCYIDNIRIFFQLDNRWTAEQKREFVQLFDLDSLLVERSFSARDTVVFDSVVWQVSRVDSNIIELSRPLNAGNSPDLTNDVFLREDDNIMMPEIIRPSLSGLPGFPFLRQNEDRFGINRFYNEKAFSYSNGIAVFFLKGYQKSRHVYLSGTFNNWSTMKTPMTRTHEGWMVSVDLKPGKYLYKFIIDGKWTEDRENRLKEFDGHAGYNSIVYCYNHTFELAGYTNAKKVFVSGSFNNWQKKELLMKRYKEGWFLSLYLKEGTHFYKYIVDGNWITDPESPNIAKDATGNENSFLGIGDTLMFRLKGHEDANTVVLTGNFNNWSRNEITMRKVPGGWEFPYITGPGNYEYKFIVDGKWMPDPDNPCTTGSGDFTNSCIAFKSNHTFFLPQFTDAKSVIVTGSFNNWSLTDYRMNKSEQGWEYTMFLPAGKHTYKFIVDGSWLIDPNNPYWEENALGTGNSVLWIER